MGSDLNAGAFLRVFVLGFFVVTAVIYGIDHVSTASPSRSSSQPAFVFFALVPFAAVQLRRLRASERRRGGDARPTARRPARAGRSGVIGVLMYVLPMTRGSCSVLPGNALSGIGSFLDAVTVVFTVMAAPRTYCGT